jgi:hypothetical protein
MRLEQAIANFTSRDTYLPLFQTRLPTIMDRELALRAHIRALLLDYCLTHLTTNYITYTENAVANVIIK